MSDVVTKASLSLSAAQRALDAAVETAAASGLPTAGLHEVISGDAMLAATVPHFPGMTTLAGGYPLLSAGVAVGAVGVAGGHHKQDCEIAEAALAAVAS